MTKEHFLGRTISEYDPPVCGDLITGECYYSPEWVEAEWNSSPSYGA